MDSFGIARATGFHDEILDTFSFFLLRPDRGCILPLRADAAEHWPNPGSNAPAHTGAFTSFESEASSNP